MSPEFNAAAAVKKPWYRRVPWWGWVAIIIVLIIAAATRGNQPSQNSAPAPAASDTPTVTATPSVQHTPTDEAASAAPPVTDREVVQAFRDFIHERAAANVLFAKAVTDISFKDRVVHVTFDPKAAGIDQETFDAVNVFDNLAEFAGAPIMFDDDLGRRLRPAIDSVSTATPDGISLGTMTTAELYYNGTGEVL